jgi:hypothetical protein
MFIAEGSTTIAVSARMLTHNCRCHDISCAYKLEECPYNFYMVMMNELTQEIHDDDG